MQRCTDTLKQRTILRYIGTYRRSEFSDTTTYVPNDEMRCPVNVFTALCLPIRDECFAVTLALVDVLATGDSNAKSGTSTL